VELLRFWLDTRQFSQVMHDCMTFSCSEVQKQLAVFKTAQRNWPWSGCH